MELEFDVDQSGFPRWIWMNFLTLARTLTHQKVTLIECYSISDAAPSAIEEGGDGRIHLKGSRTSLLHNVTTAQQSGLYRRDAIQRRVDAIYPEPGETAGRRMGVTEGRGNQSRHPPPPAPVMGLSPPPPNPPRENSHLGGQV